MLTPTPTRTPRVEQRTIFRQGNHISPHFTIRILNVLKQIVVNYLNLLGKNLFGFYSHKERNLFLWKMKKVQEIKNKWRNMVTWRNMVLCSIAIALLHLSAGALKISVYHPSSAVLPRPNFPHTLWTSKIIETVLGACELHRFNRN